MLTILVFGKLAGRKPVVSPQTKHVLCLLLTCNGIKNKDFFLLKKKKKHNTLSFLGRFRYSFTQNLGADLILLLPHVTEFYVLAWLALKILIKTISFFLIV